MATLWGIGLANALVVAVVAPLAFVVARAAKRPAWTHAVWVIVLLKLVTPPIASWSVTRTWVPRAETVAAAPRAVGLTEVNVKRPSRRVAKARAEVVEVVTEPVAAPINATRSVSLQVVLGMAWLAGSGLWVIVAAWRIARFIRAIRRADDAPAELVEIVEELSGQIGLARSPRVVMAPVRVAPMVWALGGRPCLLVPEALWGRLDREQRAAMLVHELAHLRRRDHWVRILELVATGFYWWHPALWLARRELRRAEEECCDLWVVWALPKAKRRYASALVEAVEFLSEARPRGLPIGASGMGQVEDLSRRISMIMRGDTPRGLTRAGTLAAIGLGLLLLPWRPTIAQDAPKGDDAKPAIEAPKGDEKPSADAPKGTVLEQELKRAEERLKWAEAMLQKKYVSQKQVDEDKATLAKARERLEAMRPEEDDPFAAAREQVKVAQNKEARLQQMRKQGVISDDQVGSAHAEVMEMKAKLAALEAQARKDVEVHKLAMEEAQDAVETATGNLRSHAARVAKAEAQRGVVATELAQINRLSKQGAGIVSASETARAGAEMAVADAVVAEAKAEQDQAGIELKQAKRRLAAFETDAVFAPARLRKWTKVEVDSRAPFAFKALTQIQTSTRPASRDANARIDEIEAKIDRILKEMEALRKRGEENPTRKVAAVAKAAPTVLGFSWDNALKDEDIVRALYASFVGREPNEDEMVRALAIFDDANSRFEAVHKTILRITPTWEEGKDDAFANALADHKSLNNAMIVELTYNKIANRNPTRGEVRERAYALKNGKDRREAIHSLVKKVVELPRNSQFQ